MRLIDADDFGNRMYHEAFEKDSDLQKWDSGCWIRYKLFENVLREQPTVQPDHNADIGKKAEGDCISRQAAIELCDWYDNPSLHDDLEKLPPAQPETHWIPCGERLPKEKQSVLVTDGSVIWVCDIISTDEGYKWEDNHGYWLDLDEWTAWMSLPELYHGGGELE